MTNSYYNSSGAPTYLSRGNSATIDGEYDAIAAGFALVETAVGTKGNIAGQTWTGTHVFPSTVSIGNVSATEISYLDGATSNIQTQLNTGASNLTAGLALKGNIAGQTWTGTHVFPATVSIGNVSDIEIAYLDGTTSNIQSQINGKAGLASPAFTGVPTAPTAAVGTNTDQLATMAAIVAAGLSSALPGQSLGFLRSDGATPGFTQTHTGYAQKEVKGANIASAATVDLTAATGNLVHVTGTVGITAFTVASGAEYTVVFDGILTVTHNTTTLILPTGGNLTTAAGDSWKIRGDGAGNARVVSITRADGHPISDVKGANIASASTVNLLTSTGSLVHITGTTGITAFTVSNGAEYTVVFDGIVTVTHNATTLILPTGANITTAAGDVWVIRGDGAGNVRVVSISRASGRAVLASGYELIAAVTPTAAANVDFLNTFTSDYDEYLVIGTGIDPASTDNLTLRFATGGAADAGSNYGGISSTPGSATAFNSIISSVDTGSEINFQITIYNVNSALNKAFTSVGVKRQFGANIGLDQNGGLYSNAAVVTGFRLYWGAASNFAAKGRVKVYGMRNA